MHRVLAVEAGFWRESDEELAAVGVGAAVCHTDHTTLVMLQYWHKLVGKCCTPRALAAAAGGSGIAALSEV